jgi:type III secretion protein J
MLRRNRIYAAFLVSLATLLAGCVEMEELVVVDSEKEANRILVELEQHDVNGATKTEDTRQRETVYVIKVPAEKTSHARLILVDLDLPRERSAGLSEMIDQTGLIPTRTDERARLMHAIAGELEQTLMTYDGVVQARVHVVIPDEQSKFDQSDEPAKPAATVLIKQLADAQAKKTAPTEDEVTDLVRNSIEGLRDSPPAKANGTAPAEGEETSQAQEAVTVLFTDVTVRTAKANPDEGSTPTRMEITLFAVIAGLAGLVILLILLLIRQGRRGRATDGFAPSHAA